jgi:hypothetical protein
MWVSCIGWYGAATATEVEAEVEVEVGVTTMVRVRESESSADGGVRTTVREPVNKIKIC